jgi:hypothetical protein
MDARPCPSCGDESARYWFEEVLAGRQLLAEAEAERRSRNYMDTRTGIIYDSRELAEAAGVADEDLVTGSCPALEKLRAKLVFTKGSFKTAPVACPCGHADEPWHWPRGGICTVGLGMSAAAVDPQATSQQRPSTRDKSSPSNDLQPLPHGPGDESGLT